MLNKYLCGSSSIPFSFELSLRKMFKGEGKLFQKDSLRIDFIGTEIGLII